MALKRRGQRRSIYTAWYCICHCLPSKGRGLWWREGQKHCSTDWLTRPPFFCFAPKWSNSRYWGHSEPVQGAWWKCRGHGDKSCCHPVPGSVRAHNGSGRGSSCLQKCCDPPLGMPVLMHSEHSPQSHLPSSKKHSLRDAIQEEPYRVHICMIPLFSWATFNTSTQAYFLLSNEHSEGIVWT